MGSGSRVVGDPGEVGELIMLLVLFLIAVRIISPMLIGVPVAYYFGLSCGWSVLVGILSGMFFDVLYALVKR